MNQPDPTVYPGETRPGPATRPGTGSGNGAARPADAFAPSTTPERRVLADLPSYAEAQRLVDHLSDSGFPVEHVRIVGDGVRTVEQVTGRLTKGRAALAGAASGVWFGLLFGLLFTLFVVAGLAGVLVVLGLSALLGAAWGALFGFLAHAATRGRRDFSSISGLEAERYRVEVDSGFADEAARVARDLDGNG
ncbi:general stress protein [Pseudonocardia sp.]|uniref:general stress protein n=1 Tax=Pseudonocardia sp. TaxID=60912 RepID=UPI0026298118|nr:general stress protein [Pseudonocardia sp.]